MSESLGTLKEIEQYLDSVPKFGTAGKSAVNFNLDRMRAFCEKMDNPEKNFRSVHVGGTNGKGTVCRMLASICQESGYKTGLYTSPHLLNVRERFRVNSLQMEGEHLIEFFTTYGQYIRASNYTYFEITTAIAFWFFAKANVDIAVIEVGLGGRLDATNVIQPMVSVITSVGLDHTDILGNSLKAIAFEKAGIIKERIPVVIGNLASAAEQVVQDAAISKKSEIIKTDALDARYMNQKIMLNGVHPPLEIDGRNLKKIDAQNAAITYRILETFRPDFPVQTKQIVNGIERMNKRFSNHAVFEKLHADKSWYFDGAHNVESVQTLTDHLLDMAPANQWSVVLSFKRDKLTTEIADLWNKFPNIYLYEMEGNRAATSEYMKKYFSSARVVENHNFFYSDQFKSELVIFSGSFYFYSVVSNWMGAIASADQKNPSAL